MPRLATSRLLALTIGAAVCLAPTARGDATTQGEPVSGSVTHQDGTAYAGVTVTMLHTTYSSVIVDATTTTAADGSYSMSVPERAGYQLRLDPDDTGAPEKGATLDVTGPTTVPPLTLPDYQYVDLTGTVTDDAGDGLADATVAVYRDDRADCFGCRTPYAYREDPTRTVMTDAQGGYALTHVRVGAVLDLLASKLGYEPTTLFGQPWVRGDESCCAQTVDTTHLQLAPVKLGGDGVHRPKLRFLHALRLRGPAHLGASIPSNADYYGVDPLATTARFTWLRDGQPIHGPFAHNIARPPTRADAGHMLQLLESAVYVPYYDPGMRRSNALRVPWPGIHLTPGPIRVGSPVTFLENDGEARHGRYTHVQWLLDGTAIPGAVHLVYRPKPGDVGHRLSVRNSSDTPAIAPPRLSHARIVHHAVS